MFSSSPGIHKVLTDTLLKPIMSVGGTPTNEHLKKAGKNSPESVKAALWISGADQRRYGALKDVLANNYLLGTD